MAERIVVGSPSAPLFTFTNADLIDCKCVLTSSLSGDELAIDQFMPVVYSASYIRVGFVPVDSTGLITADGMKFMVFPGTNHVDKIPYGAEIRYYSNNNLVGKFYSQRVIRSGKPDLIFWLFLQLEFWTISSTLAAFTQVKRLIMLWQTLSADHSRFRVMRMSQALTFMDGSQLHREDLTSISFCLQPVLRFTRGMTETLFSNFRTLQT